MSQKIFPAGTDPRQSGDGVAGGEQLSQFILTSKAADEQAPVLTSTPEAESRREMFNRKFALS